MAVIQISKIQVRRGKKNSDSGVPQLSSAEFAWAVDSQELYIGNGSVAEGAPYVGNTKILTEHDNILELANVYRFANDDPSITGSVSRTLQSKLDETVSILDFGAVGDGSTDCTAAFELAFTELFRNINDNYKKVLVIPNGEYLITSNLEIPSNANIKGETNHGVIINIGANNISLLNRSGQSVTEFTSSNRPEKINISNLTIQRTTGQFNISGLTDSVFDSVTLRGSYILGDTVASLALTPAAVYWTNTIDKPKVTDVSFKNCRFESNAISVKFEQLVSISSEINFTGCKFFVNDTAIYIDGVSGQGNNWLIYDCDFREIANQAFRSTNGYHTTIQRCKFTLVGNGADLAASPTDPMVFFGENRNNILLECSSDRFQAAAVTSSETKGSIVEAYNSGKTSLRDRIYADVTPFDGFKTLAVFSAYNKFIELDYFLSLGEFSRHGRLRIVVGDNHNEVAISDDFVYSSTLASSFGGTLMTNFEFAAELKNNNNIITDDSAAELETVVLKYSNPLPGLNGTLSFDITYGV